MILLVRPKYVDLFSGLTRERAFWSEARIPEGTRIYFTPDLPEEDAEGHPVLAWKVSAGETHYWRGEPLILSDVLKRK